MLVAAIAGFAFTVSAQTIETKSLNSPDQATSLEKGKMETVTVAGATLHRITFQPGWKWSDHMKPTAKTESCQKRHLMYIVSGRLKVLMDDGTQVELSPGDFTVIEPGHDGWVVGDEPAVALEMAAIENSHK
ncbi:MAG: cupin domain-containing protein [Bacteroidetes bacterium]|nr:cupin domain-containing protein [Bacteroidota bacterium]